MILIEIFFGIVISFILISVLLRYIGKMCFTRPDVVLSEYKKGVDVYVYQPYSFSNDHKIVLVERNFFKQLYYMDLTELYSEKVYHPPTSKDIERAWERCQKALEKEAEAEWETDRWKKELLEDSKEEVVELNKRRKS